MLFFLVFVRSAARNAVRNGYAQNQKELEAQWEETNSSAPFVTACYVQEGAPGLPPHLVGRGPVAAVSLEPLSQLHVQLRNPGGQLHRECCTQD